MIIVIVIVSIIMILLRSDYLYKYLMEDLSSF